MTSVVRGARFSEALCFNNSKGRLGAWKNPGDLFLMGRERRSRQKKKYLLMNALTDWLSCSNNRYFNFQSENFWILKMFHWKFRGTEVPNGKKRIPLWNESGIGHGPWSQNFNGAENISTQRRHTQRESKAFRRKLLGFQLTASPLSSSILASLKSPPWALQAGWALSHFIRPAAFSQWPKIWQVYEKRRVRSHDTKERMASGRSDGFSSFFDFGF